MRAKYRVVYGSVLMHSGSKPVAWVYCRTNRVCQCDSEYQAKKIARALNEAAKRAEDEKRPVAHTDWTGE